MNIYELAVLYHPDLEIDLDKATQKVTKIITAGGGKITADDNWGKRKLSYTIKGLGSAVYVFYTVELPPEAVRKVEASLNITDEVIRFLITKVDFKAIAKAEAARAARAKKAASRQEHETKQHETEEINEEEE
ncbi:MAG TPA: 30S ribosomal protein S6 [Patescibacteria group bacterium]|nr:30S ribosomal protein S6 [Patescibacteria group bacterium]